MAEILVGTSGYSYDDWRGAFYPLQLKRGDMLEYYAREFRYTEVNSTYYALPSMIPMAVVIQLPISFSPITNHRSWRQYF